MATQQNAALLDEIRFIKQQMLAVAAFGLGLTFGVFGLTHEAKLSSVETAVIIGTFWLPVIAGATFLYRLQAHLKTTRIALDGIDKDPWLRGIGVVRVLIGTLVLGAVAASYILWQHPKA
jgi:EamA domain-containing membrane protein RarD